MASVVSTMTGRRALNRRAPALTVPLYRVMSIATVPDVEPRRLAVTRLNVTNARCAALFASGLRRSGAPTADELTSWINAAVRRFGVAGCVGQMAQEFGDHPEEAARRMRWIRELISAPSAAASLRRTGPGSPGLAPYSTQPTADGVRRAA